MPWAGQREERLPQPAHRSTRSAARAASFAEQRKPLGQQLRHGAADRLGIAGNRVQVVEREAAPRGAQNAQPGHAILRIEQGASQRQRIQHLRTARELFQFHGAERDSGLAQSLRRWERGGSWRGPERRCGISHRMRGPARWSLDGRESDRRFRQSALRVQLSFSSSRESAAPPRSG